jgi:hypothetical protein
MNSTIAGLEKSLNRNTIQMNSTLAGLKNNLNRNTIQMNSINSRAKKAT